MCWAQGGSQTDIRKVVENALVTRCDVVLLVSQEVRKLEAATLANPVQSGAKETLVTRRAVF